VFSLLRAKKVAAAIPRLCLSGARLFHGAPADVFAFVRNKSFSFSQFKERLRLINETWHSTAKAAIDI
jgi:hypothetical protein